MIKYSYLIILLPFFAFSTGFAHRTDDIRVKENKNFHFEQLDPSSAEWKRLSVRDPNEAILDQAYLTNLYHSVQFAFAPWFRGEKKFSRVPYTEMLKVQHVILKSGIRGDHDYNGATLLSHGQVPASVPPGKFRFEMNHLDPNERVTLSLPIIHKLGGVLTPHTARIQQIYKSSPEYMKIEEKPVDPKKSELLIQYGKYASFDVMRLPRIQTNEVAAWNEIFENWVTHYYPARASGPYILAAMESIIHDIMDLKKLPTFGPQEVDTFITRLAEYLYLGIHGHLFHGANFSLFMSQVNFLLMEFGLVGISHHNLDWLGLVEQFDHFHKEFYNHIFQVNPKLSPQPYQTTFSSDDRHMNILVHIAEVGDGFFCDGSVAEGAACRTQLEGFALIAPRLPDGLKLEYKAILSGIGETQWYSEGQYAGTRGQSRPMENFAIRLVGNFQNSYSIKYQARFGNWFWTDVQSDGNFVAPTEESASVTALQVWIEKID